MIQMKNIGRTIRGVYDMRVLKVFEKILKVMATIALVPLAILGFFEITKLLWRKELKK